MSSSDLRRKFIEFFRNKGHKHVPSSLLVPENDPSVLFTTAGMQQFKGYYLKPEDAVSSRVITIQPCFRTSDIDEVGDDSHLTLFEMLGNFSFGYAETLHAKLSADGHPKNAKLALENDLSLRGAQATKQSNEIVRQTSARLSASADSLASPPASTRLSSPGGSLGGPSRDGSRRAALPDGIVSARNDNQKPYFKQEAIEWGWEFLTSPQWLGLDKAKLSATYFEDDGAIGEDTQSKSFIEQLDGITEIKTGNKEDNFWGPTGVEGPCGPTVEFYYNGLEIWNLVFNEYYFKDNQYTKLEYQGVDTGAGFERLLTVINDNQNVYQTDILSPLVEIAASVITDIRKQRIVADHIRALTFAVADGIVPSNKDAGYVARRLVRRAMVVLGDDAGNIINRIVNKVVELYGADYPRLTDIDINIISGEITKWEPVKAKGQKIIASWLDRGEDINGKMAFDLYQSHGFPVELTQEIASAAGIKVDTEGYWKEYEAHKVVSRQGLEGKFKGGLAGHSDIEIRYHSTAHLLLSSLREVLGEKVFQRGANINTERLRFDFSCDHALTKDEIARVEALVNDKISQNLPVVCEEMTQAEAEARGAVGTFKDRYGDKVKIYTIGSKEKPCSMEFCGGPHVANTSEIGYVKIVKEESAGAGVRRFRAKLE